MRKRDQPTGQGTLPTERPTNISSPQGHLAGRQLELKTTRPTATEDCPVTPYTTQCFLSAAEDEAPPATSPHPQKSPQALQPEPRPPGAGQSPDSRSPAKVPLLVSLAFLPSCLQRLEEVTLALPASRGLLASTQNTPSTATLVCRL